MSKLFAFVLVCGMALASLGNAGEILSSVDASTLPKNKMTQAGLYLSPADAHTALTNDQSIVFIDARDPVEISFVGHPKGVDAIVPLRIVTHNFKAKAGKYAAKNNPTISQTVVSRNKSVALYTRPSATLDIKVSFFTVSEEPQQPELSWLWL